MTRPEAGAGATRRAMGVHRASGATHPESGLATAGRSARKVPLGLDRGVARRLAPLLATKIDRSNGSLLTTLGIRWEVGATVPIL